MVVGYSRGYDPASLEITNGYYTLHQRGQFFVYTCFGKQCTDPKLRKEEAERELQKKLFFTFFTG